MRIAIVGSGYVGLVAAVCFAEMGHKVHCIDTDTAKIEYLCQGKSPIYEPGLQELLERNISSERLYFTTSFERGIESAEVCFFAVGTPSLEDGAVNLTDFFKAVRSVAQCMQAPLLLVNKSTVPVGTAQQVRELVQKVLTERDRQLSFSVASNPEFLKEGDALQDFMKPDRVVLGVEDSSSEILLRSLYAPFTFSCERILVMDVASAELSKYACNAMLALRISFINQLTELCESCNADIMHLRSVLGSDQRIGRHFLYPSPGFGGSCFPKDVQALYQQGQAHAIDLGLIQQILQANDRQKVRVFDKLHGYFAMRGGLEGKVIALWGLSFKPNTDDVRESPALFLLDKLLSSKAYIRAYDPVAKSNAAKIFPESPQLRYCSNEKEAVQGADAVILMTEWKQFRSVDLLQLRSWMAGNLFFDCRNQYQPEKMSEKGFVYMSLGRATSEVSQMEE